MSSDRNSLENFLEMSKKPGKEFLSYVWYYYRWHIVVILAAVIAIVVTVVQISNRQEPALTLYLFDTCSMDETKQMEVDYAAFADVDLNQYAVIVQSNMSMKDAASQSGIEAAELFFTRVAAGELDAVTMNLDQFSQYDRDLFLDLRQCLPEELLAALQGRLYFMDAAGTGTGSFQHDKMTDPVPVGIDLIGCRIFSQYYAFTDDSCILGICHNTENVENAAAYIAYLFSDLS